MSILCMADSVSASDTANNFIINLDDTSPVIVYSASEDASQSSNFSAGWIVSGPSTGTSLHSTAADGASLTLQWNGEYKLFHFGVIFRGMVKGNLHYSACVDVLLPAGGTKQIPLVVHSNLRFVQHDDFNF